MNQREADRLREKYPNHIPLQQASEYLGVSPRQLSKLIANGREPFAAIGANIGTSQKYIRIYTERLAENGQVFAEADAWLDLWCHTVCRDMGNTFSFLAPAIYDCIGRIIGEPKSFEFFTLGALRPFEIPPILDFDTS